VNRIIEAAQFADKAHRGQFRKYEKVPYIVHPMRVAGLVTAHEKATEDVIVAAWIHDVVEDTDHTFEDIFQKFGMRVARIVAELTKADDPEFKARPRRERKRMEADKLGKASWEARFIKLADRLDNLRDLELGDAPPDFVKLYVEESYYLSCALMETDARLYSQLFALLMRMKEKFH